MSVDFNARRPPIALLSAFEHLLPYQLDQVLELIRLRVEVVDQEGLELLCGGVVGGGEGGRRRKGGRER